MNWLYFKLRYPGMIVVTTTSGNAPVRTIAPQEEGANHTKPLASTPLLYMQALTVTPSCQPANVLLLIAGFFESSLPSTRAD